MVRKDAFLMFTLTVHSDRLPHVNQSINDRWTSPLNPRTADCMYSDVCSVAIAVILCAVNVDCLELEGKYDRLLQDHEHCKALLLVLVCHHLLCHFKEE